MLKWWTAVPLFLILSAIGLVGTGTFFGIEAGAQVDTSPAVQEQAALKIEQDLAPLLSLPGTATATVTLQDCTLEITQNYDRQCTIPFDVDTTLGKILSLDLREVQPEIKWRDFTQDPNISVLTLDLKRDVVSRLRPLEADINALVSTGHPRDLAARLDQITQMTENSLPELGINSRQVYRTCGADSSVPPSSYAMILLKRGDYEALTSSIESYIARYCT